MSIFSDPLTQINEYCDILKSINAGQCPIAVSGLSVSQKAHIAFSICEHLQKKCIVITHSDFEAKKIARDISMFSEDGVVLFPSRQVVLFSAEAQNNEFIYDRLSALQRIIKGNYSAVVTSVEALMNKIMSPAVFSDSVLSVALCQNIDMEYFIGRLVSIGYESTDMVEGKGQFSKRGGIIDVFPINSKYAVRVELFDEIVDSLRYFDINTQRSIENIEKVDIIPATEYVIEYDRVQKAAQIIEIELKTLIDSFRGKIAAEMTDAFKNAIGEDIERLKTGRYFTGMDKYASALIDAPSTAIDYIGNDALIFIDEPDRCKQATQEILNETGEIIKGLVDKAKFLPQYADVLWDFTQILDRVNVKNTVAIGAFIGTNIQPKPVNIYSFPSRTLNSYYGKFNMAAEQVRQWKREGYRIIIFAGPNVKAQKLSEMLSSENIENVFADKAPDCILPGQIIVMHGSLNNGFEYPSAKIVLISDKDVVGRERKYSGRTDKDERAKIKVFTDLNIGDYVVHYAHGVGRYIGIEKLVVEGITKDYLKIEYLNNDFLYIPTMQMDLLQKYIGSGGRMPKLNKLGGTDWANTKKKVKESLKQFAGELVKLYAEREKTEGFAFSPDNVWQAQFEDTFLYEETPDQLKCIEEVKKDMQMRKPMDRLLCGDVGYGKTEVAIRAAFKAVMDDKQVAYLVPTTILAQQHFENFTKRMADFPINVEMLSRFRTTSEQKTIIEDLKKGKIDIVIGTHRILQEDVIFKELGLLIIDEEHRFGVAHKERLKNIKKDIDVLTLTATPIPRTLHMSLSGIRDISTIEDPPAERYPVQTYVMEYDRDVVNNAIVKELGRNGQVFYLYNRVRSIYRKAKEISDMFPDARVAVAHGQMDEGKLEDLMTDFVNGEYDILVCTTIIESGLDIPNVNTIIIEDADNMGLAQLYQLRGRVGRANRMAYAYITYKKDKMLNEQAEKRLQTIREFTEFGSGFKIAMRDLEIRGAGNLLGPEQHGHMAAVGYEMYCRLLEEAVCELRGKLTVAPINEVAIDISVNAYVDNKYIEDELQRIETYKKIALIRDDADVSDVCDELTDRYGDMPIEVSNLVKIAEIKAIAMDTGIARIAQKAETIIFEFKDSKNPNIDMISRVIEKYKGHIVFNASDLPYLSYQISDYSQHEFLRNIKFILQDLKNFAESHNIHYN